MPFVADDPLEYTQFDTDPPLEADLEEKDPDSGLWVPMDLTGKTVRLLAQNRRSLRMFGGDAEVVTVAPPVPAPAGWVAPSRVRYTLQAGDLADPGEYVYQWEVSTPSGARRTVPPGDDWWEFTVARKLGAPV
jgi:hypothetical protein